MHYLDNAATTAVLPEVAEAVQTAMLEGWANPASLYRAGAAAEKALEAARAALTAAMGVALKGEERAVFFTGGGTEADNIAVLGAARARAGWADHLVATGYEHPGVAGPLALLCREGFTLTQVPPGPDGRVDIDALAAAVGPKTALVCAMQVNNETGAVLDVAALAAAVKEKNSRCFVHVDGVQGFCRLPLALGSTVIDSYALSGHKLHAPKGVGALYLSPKSRGAFIPPIVGGGQQQGVRPGTENTPGAAGLARAVALALEQKAAHGQTVAALRARLLAGVAALDEITLLSPPDGWAGIAMLGLPKGLRSQVMLNYLDECFEVCVSSGSACKGGAPSHTLQAMGLPAHVVDSAIRVSFDGHNTEADIDALLEGLRAGLKTLARLR